MSANIVPFESKGLPAHIKARLGNIDNSSLGRATSSFPVVSIKGKQFSVVKEGDRSIIEDPRTGEPASSIQVAIVRVNPGLSKAYYAGGYVEGVESKPECFSNDGIRPDPNAEEAQAKSCASCPFNAFGSASTGKGKACRDTKRMAIATVDNLEEPMMLRVPATSLKNLAQYGKLLTEKGVDTRFVATRIGFDPHSTHQVLTFKPVGFLDEETVLEIERLQDEESILQITGEQSSSAPARVQAEAPVARPKPTVVKAAPQGEEDEEDEDEAPAPAPAPKATKPKVVVRQDVDEDEDEAPAPVAKATPKVAPKPTAKPKAVVRQDTGDDDGLSDDIGSFLSGGFDDD